MGFSAVVLTLDTLNAGTVGIAGIESIPRASVADARRKKVYLARPSNGA